jgi:hypothetical protein
MYHFRNLTLLLSTSVLFFITLVGCNKAQTASSIAEPPKNETYFIEVTDYTSFFAESSIIDKARTTLKEKHLVEGQNLQTADWPIRIRLTNSLAEQMRHKGPGRAPFHNNDTLGVLLNAFCFLGWATMEVGKGAINAGTPDTVVNMSVNLIDTNGTVLRIKNDILLYTQDLDKIKEDISSKAVNKIAKHIETIREDKPIENAIVETNEYALKKIHGDI